MANNADHDTPEDAVTATRTSEPVVREYRRLAHRYDARWASYIDTSVTRTIQRLAPEAGEHLLDVGCGTGELLHRIRTLRPSCRLTGIDLTDAMLAVTRERLAGAVDLVRAHAGALPFHAGTFHRVVSASVLHYVAAPAAALREARRVLRPGGRLVVTDWCRDFLPMKALDLYLRIANAAHVRTLSSRELVRLMEQVGFRNVTVQRYRAGGLWGLMTVVAETPPAQGEASSRAR